MSAHVLVIDGNSAVQAIAALALNQTNCLVEPLTDGGKAKDRIQVLKPSVVLCARDINGLDPYELAKQTKLTQPETKFVLLASGDARDEISAQALAAGYQEVLFKPFKSNRLRDVVIRLLEAPTPGHTARGLVVHIKQATRAKLLQRVLSKAGATYRNYENQRTLDDGCAVCIAGWQEAKELTPAERIAATDLLLLVSEKEKKEAVQSFPGAKLLDLPLSSDAVLNALKPYLSDEQRINLTRVPISLRANSDANSEKESNSAVAAKLSAALYERFLQEPDFQEKNVDQLARIASEEIKRFSSQRMSAKK